MITCVFQSGNGVIIRKDIPLDEDIIFPEIQSEMWEKGFEFAYFE